MLHFSSFLTKKSLQSHFIRRDVVRLSSRLRISGRAARHLTACRRTEGVRRGKWRWYAQSGDFVSAKLVFKSGFKDVTLSLSPVWKALQWLLLLLRLFKLHQPWFKGDNWLLHTSVYLRQHKWMKVCPSFFVLQIPHGFRHNILCCLSDFPPNLQKTALDWLCLLSLLLWEKSPQSCCNKKMTVKNSFCCAMATLFEWCGFFFFLVVVAERVGRSLLLMHFGLILLTRLPICSASLHTTLASPGMNPECCSLLAVRSFYSLNVKRVKSR